VLAPHLFPSSTSRGQVQRMPIPSLLMIPPACASFMFFHATKRLLKRLRQARDRNHASFDWRTISEALDRPLALPYIMVTGPRWNPHALIATVGPFEVQHGLRIRAETAYRSARMWTLVIYREPDSRTVASINSNSAARNDVWNEQALPPGRYSAILRYYEWSGDPRLPEIELDGRRRVHERAVPANENDYLNRLTDKNGAFYTCLHYYVVEMLRLRRLLPETFLQREYLPVGNPETAFRYGYLHRGQCIEITSSHDIPAGHRLYLTIYNRSSFPVAWREVGSLPYRTEPADAIGSYLLRLHGMQAPQAAPSWPPHLQVVVR
jgi:Family of unknown function (DUF6208)